VRQFRNASARAKGFTLIELMITVAILSIIAAVAIPSYTKQIQKNNRAVAKARLSQAVQQLERFYSDNNSYLVDKATSTCTLIVGTAASQNGLMLLVNPTWNCSGSNTLYSGSNNEANSAYTVAFTGTPTTSTYTLQATAVGTQTGDTQCGNLTLTNAGVKGISGTGSVTTCW